jgi:hypothetical protein
VGAVGGDVRLFERPLGADGTLRVTVGLNGEVGASRAAGSTVFGGMVGLPIGFPVGQGDQGTRVVPFVTPGFALTNAGGAPTSNGYGMQDYGRFVLGGGVGVTSSVRNLSGTIGFQHVALGRADTQVGLVLSLGGR